MPSTSIEHDLNQLRSLSLTTSLSTNISPNPILNPHDSQLHLQEQQKLLKSHTNITDVKHNYVEKVNRVSKYIREGSNVSYVDSLEATDHDHNPLHNRDTTTIEESYTENNKNINMDDTTGVNVKKVVKEWNNKMEMEESIEVSYIEESNINNEQRELCRELTEITDKNILNITQDADTSILTQDSTIELNESIQTPYNKYNDTNIDIFDTKISIPDTPPNSPQCMLNGNAQWVKVYQKKLDELVKRADGKIGEWSIVNVKKDDNKNNKIFENDSESGNDQQNDIKINFGNHLIDAQNNQMKHYYTLKKNQVSNREDDSKNVLNESNNVFMDNHTTPINQQIHSNDNTTNIYNVQEPYEDIGKSVSEEPIIASSNQNDDLEKYMDNEHINKDNNDIVDDSVDNGEIDKDNNELIDDSVDKKNIPLDGLVKNVDKHNNLVETMNTENNNKDDTVYSVNNNEIDNQVISQDKFEKYIDFNEMMNTEINEKDDNAETNEKRNNKTNDFDTNDFEQKHVVDNTDSDKHIYNKDSEGVLVETSALIDTFNNENNSKVKSIDMYENKDADTDDLADNQDIITPPLSTRTNSLPTSTSTSTLPTRYTQETYTLDTMHTPTLYSHMNNPHTDDMENDSITTFQKTIQTETTILEDDSVYRGDEREDSLYRRQHSRIIQSEKGKLQLLLRNLDIEETVVDTRVTFGEDVTWGEDGVTIEDNTVGDCDGDNIEDDVTVGTRNVVDGDGDSTVNTVDDDDRKNLESNFKLLSKIDVSDPAILTPKKEDIISQDMRTKSTHKAWQNVVSQFKLKCEMRKVDNDVQELLLGEGEKEVANNGKIRTPEQIEENKKLCQMLAREACDSVDKFKPRIRGSETIQQTPDPPSQVQPMNLSQNLPKFNCDMKPMELPTQSETNVEPTSESESQQNPDLYPEFQLSSAFTVIKERPKIPSYYLLLPPKWAFRNNKTYTCDITFYNHFISKSSKTHPPRKDRYQLYVSHVCPLSHAVMIVHNLLKLESVIELIQCDSKWSSCNNWTYTNKITQQTHLIKQLYEQQPDHFGKYTLPLIYDTQLDMIVTNDYQDILHMLIHEFGNDFNTNMQLLPPGLEACIQEISSWLIPNFIWNVYSCGFTTCQETYNQAIDEFTLYFDKIVNILNQRSYLCGETMTLPDIYLFCILIKYEDVYNILFKMNTRCIVQYECLVRFMKRMCQRQEIRESLDMETWKQIYFGLQELNPSGIVPVGEDWMEIWLCGNDDEDKKDEK